MFDFVAPNEVVKRDHYEVSFDFKVGPSKDLMIKGGKFYAIWDEENKIWTTDEFRAIELIDSSLRDYISEKYSNKVVSAKYISSTLSGVADRWKRYITKLMPDNFKPLNTKVIFKSQDTKRSDYSSIRVDYDLEEGEPENYNKMFSKFFSAEELQKLEWAIGSILTGDSKKIQKFIVLYGDPGTGKSTFIDYVVKALFPGYYTEFTAKNLASGSEQFAMEPFKDNPLVAIQSDGDLSKVMDCTRLNSIVSHEEMVINEKHKSQYKMKVDSFLFMATNLPVDISSSRSGLNRRLIVVEPTGQKFSPKEYDKLIDKIIFEKGKIANKCINVYKELGKSYYNSYVPTNMKKFTDEFYNFVEEDYYTNFKDSDYVRGVDIWNRYKLYCERNNVRFPLSYLKFRTELYSYFKEFIADTNINGVHMRNVYRGFKKSKIGLKEEEDEINDSSSINWIILRSIPSLLDGMLSSQPAQYGKEDGTPEGTWSTVRTVLRDINTNELHYILVPINHIVIDFDLKDENGNKSLEKNLEAASKWPKTYVEVSKGGQGLHLHYIYDGDPTMLRSVYEPGIEVKVFNGRSALRRKLSLCNDIPVAHILNGLPLKEEKKVLNFEGFNNEKQLRKFIDDCFNKKHHGATKPEVDFIFKALNDTYKSGMQYDVRDLRQKVYLFCLGSTHQKDACKIIFNKMKFCSKEYEEEELKGEVTTNVIDYRSLIEAPIIFLDIEVYPNLFLICWKFEGEDKECVRMYNPPPEKVEELFRYRIIGYNNRRYDNHICYAASMGYSNMQLFSLSQKIINNKTSDAFIGEAYNLSYTDVYDFASTKQSLKKWEIELGIHHQEMNWPWDKPIPEELWEEVGKYCCNDVIATEKVFNHLKADFVAREILADISGLTVNDTTNMHTMKIITGGDKRPQDSYIYTNLATGERSDGTVDKIKFPGYIFNATKSGKEKSTYKGFNVGEGGMVWALIGMYGPTIVLDVASMHPSSIEALNLFGPYTKNFSKLKVARIYIKHKEYDKAGELFDGKLKKYLTDDDMAKALSYALKIAINSVYGLTSATFPNKLKDPRNVDNIVAKRGALFMIDLLEQVKAKGYKAIHIKTDSIKITNYDQDIIDFVIKFGQMYGYTFEVEDIYDRICLVNNAVYIARHKEDHTWTATGAEFAHPYIFKTLFSKENVEFKDLCETKSVTSNMYLRTKDGELIFVGKVGSFVPMKHGLELLRESEDKEGNKKYDAVVGTKGYLWREAEYVKEYELQDDIDYSYFDFIANEAKKHISEFGDFDAFVNGEPIVGTEELEEELPFD